MEQTTTQRIAGQVRGILAQRRLTGRWLARELGVAPTTFSRRLSGDFPFTVDELAAVARVLSVPVTSLFPPDGDQEPMTATGHLAKGA